MKAKSKKLDSNTCSTNKGRMGSFYWLGQTALDILTVEGLLDRVKQAFDGNKTRIGNWRIKKATSKDDRTKCSAKLVSSAVESFSNCNNLFSRYLLGLYLDFCIWSKVFCFLRDSSPWTYFQNFNNYCSTLTADLHSKNVRSILSCTHCVIKERRAQSTQLWWCFESFWKFFMIMFSQHYELLRFEMGMLELPVLKHKDMTTMIECIWVSCFSCFQTRY